VSPESFLPAEPDAPASPSLPPWEKFPADFTNAPPPEDRPPWPVSNTGPMYVWNPAATTGPLTAVNDDAENPAAED
jgi:hypothetical protein